MKSYAFPGNIEEDILNIGAQQVPYMRTATFSQIMKETEQMLLQLIGCNNGRIIFYTASGTGAMDSVVSNYVKEKGKAFIIDGGSFGHRWITLCEYYHVNYDVMKVPFAKDIDYDELEKMVKISQPQVFLCQHHETSTGQLFNIEKISTICHKYGVKLIVDVISTFLADPLYMDIFGIDICIASSQKGLNIPPGASLIFLSKTMLNEPFRHGIFYFDFQENLKNLERGQTPYSPATSIFLQMHERVKQDIELGADFIINQVRNKAFYFREKCKLHQWDIPAEIPSNSITGFFLHNNGNILFEELQKKKIYIMPGGTPNYFRVSHMGVQSKDDLDELVNAIAEIENRRI